MRDRQRRNINTDGHNYLGEATGAVRWVRVLHCPKDDPADLTPMFTPGTSKFAFDQFVCGLKEEIWPVGMRVEVEFFRYSKVEIGHRRERYQRVKRYTVTARMKYLVGTLEMDQRWFVEEAEEHFREMNGRKANGRGNRG